MVHMLLPPNHFKNWQLWIMYDIFITLEPAVFTRQSTYWSTHVSHKNYIPGWSKCRFIFVLTWQKEFFMTTACPVWPGERSLADCKIWLRHLQTSSTSASFSFNLNIKQTRGLMRQLLVSYSHQSTYHLKLGLVEYFWISLFHYCSMIYSRMFNSSKSTAVSLMAGRN